MIVNSRSGARCTAPRSTCERVAPGSATIGKPMGSSCTTNRSATVLLSRVAELQVWGGVRRGWWAPCSRALPTTIRLAPSSHRGLPISLSFKKALGPAYDSAESEVEESEVEESEEE